MSKDNVVALSSPDVVEDPLTELLRTGARRLIQQAIEAELAELLARYEGQADEQGRRVVVRNGYLPEREILTGVGPVAVKVPKVRSRTGESVVFRSSLVPPYVRKSRRMEAALPWLYLKGISTGRMQEALEVLVGPEAKGLSASVIGRLKRQWEAEYDPIRRMRHWMLDEQIASEEQIKEIDREEATHVRQERQAAWDHFVESLSDDLKAVDTLLEEDDTPRASLDDSFPSLYCYKPPWLVCCLGAIS